MELVKLGESEARSLTDRIKASAEDLWHMLLEAYEGGAHTALGYSSWGAYFEAEFGGKQSRGYQLIDAGRVVKAIESHSTIVESPNEAQARELAPLAKEDPDGAVEVWNEVVLGTEGKPTAADVKEAVNKRSSQVGTGILGEVSEVSRIVRVRNIEYVVEFGDGAKHTVPRTKVLDEGYKKCSECSGHGVIRKGNG